MDKGKLEQLRGKIQSDYEDYISQLKKCDFDTIVNKSYPTSVGQTLVDAIESYMEIFEEDNDFLLSEETVNIIINFPSNAVVYWIENHRNIRHPERYNYDSWYDDLPEVIDTIFKAWEDNYE